MRIKLKNFDIYKFNRDVNQSLGPDAQYEKWAVYRQDVSGFIEKAVKRDDDCRSVMVCGAGNLNDIEVGFLLSLFEKVTLSDADIKSVREGLMRQRVSEKDAERVEIIQADYTGAQKAGFFQGLEKLAKRAAPAGELAEYIEKIFPEMEPDPPPGAFDAVISCPVYTQLVYIQIEVFLKILNEYGLYEYRGLNLILNAAYSAIPRLLAKYNDFLIASCKKDGKILLFADVIEMQAKSAVYRKTYELMTKQKGNPVRMEKHAKRHGIELSLTGLGDLCLKADKIDYFYSIWPFSDEKEYLVHGIILKK